MALFADFTRPRQGRVLAGVCAGIARKTGVEPSVVRWLAAGAVVFAGMGLWVYPLLWALMPDEGAETAVVDDLIGRAKQWQAENSAAKTDTRPQAARPQEVFNPYQEPRI